MSICPKFSHENSKFYRHPASQWCLYLYAPSHSAPLSLGEQAPDPPGMWIGLDQREVRLGEPWSGWESFLRRQTAHKLPTPRLACQRR